MKDIVSISNFCREQEPGEGTLLGEIFVSEDERLRQEAIDKKAAGKEADKAAGPSADDKKGKKGKKDKDKASKKDKSSKKGKDKDKDKGKTKEDECVSKSIIHKQTQTPITIPEIIVLSELATLGELSYK